MKRSISLLLVLMLLLFLSPRVALHTRAAEKASPMEATHSPDLQSLDSTVPPTTDGCGEGNHDYVTTYHFGYRLYTCRACSHSYTENTMVVLEEDVEATAVFSAYDEYAFFTFTPKRSETYKFSSFGPYGTYCYLLSDQKKELASSYDTSSYEEGDPNFKMSYYLTAGKTYYYIAKFSEPTGSFKVKLEAVHTYITHETQEGTCTERGQILYRCSCGHSYVEYTTYVHVYQRGLCILCGAEESITGTLGDLLWNYYTETGKLVISGTGEMPAYDKGYLYPWYTYRTQIQSLVIEDGVTSIGSYAFDYSYNAITSITIGNTVTTLEKCALEGCSSITQLFIPASVRVIAVDAISRSHNITGIWVSEENGFFSNDESGVLFNKEKTTLLYFPNGRTGTYSIPETVTTIGEDAFFGSSLTDITIPNGVTVIGDRAFSCCDNLTSLILPKSVTYIGDYGISDCLGLTSLVIEGGVTYMGQGAFCWCMELETVVLSEGTTVIGKGAFSTCPALSALIIPDSVTIIEAEAFHNCGITTLTIPENVSSISPNAFGFNSCLEELRVVENNPYYSSDVRGILYNKDKTVLISCPGGINDFCSIPESVTTIEDFAFFANENLTGIYIPESVTTIGDCAFECCSNLFHVHFGGETPALSNYAFYGCSSELQLLGPEDSSFWDEGVIISQPGCTERGRVMYTCTQCGAIKEDYLTPTGKHTYENGACILCGKEDRTYALTDTLKSGDQVIIVAVAKNMALSANYQGAYNAALPVIPVDGILEDPAEELIWTVGTEGDYYTFSYKGQKLAMGTNYYRMILGEQNDTWQLLPAATPNAYYVRNVNRQAYMEYYEANGNWDAYSAPESEDGFALQFYVRQADPAEDSSLKMGHTLNLTSDISLNYLVSKSLLNGYDISTVYMESTLDIYNGNEKTGTKTLRIEPVEHGNYYYFTLTGLTAIHMNDQIRSVLHGIKNGNVYFSPTDTYSVASYAYAQLSKPTIPATLKTLCADLLRYGGKTQIFKAYRTDNLADSAMTEAHRSYLSDLDSVTFGKTNSVIDDVEIPDIIWVGKSLSLDSKVVLKFIFDPKNYTGDLTKLSLHVRYADLTGNDKTLVLTDPELYNQNLGYYVFTLDSLTAAELRIPISVQIYAENVPASSTLLYSADTYGNNKTGALLDVCKALFAYSDSARAYFLS